MCGIAGEICFENDVSTQNVETMLDVLAPRGPDDKGVYTQGGVILGHRRLSVIDLSEHGHQPMYDADLGLTLVFNGCIYNYRELRKELEALGYSFFSTSDSEVVLKAYHHWQEDSLHKLVGMFAFALVQRDSGDVFLARDRLGIKPLYYHASDKGLWFASTLPALLKCQLLPVEIEPAALNQFMSFRTTVEDLTLFKGIKKLKAGHWMKVARSGEMIDHSYWSVPVVAKREQRSETEWKKRLKKALYTSVERRLVADVPVGVLLSGGLDSSLLVGILDDLGQKDIHTFSIGFENVEDEEGNEFKYSDVIAEHYGTRHHRIYAANDTLLENIEPCIEAMAEPMVSHDVIGFYLLAKDVSQHVKVVQSGQGADEVFGGYHWYAPMLDADRDNAADVYAENYFSWNDEDLQEVLAPDYRGGPSAKKYIRDYFSACESLLPVDQALHIDTGSMVVDDPVKRVDNMTMAFGLEARVPFLDHELVELAFEMPYELKLRDGGKYLLREIARDLIPHEVIDRPKGYFPVPPLRKMQGEYLELARNVFSQPHARERGLFNMDYIDQMLEKPEKFIGRFGSRLWQVTLLELWLTKHDITLHH